jgi:glycosyltransferase involved in cell wall biosynthesis
MTFCIITHVPHGINDNRYFAYAPYVREMNIWLKYVDDVIVVAPLETMEQTAIHIDYDKNITFSGIPKMDLLSIKAIFSTLGNLPGTCLKIYKAMKKADHIHLRCPGNTGLLGCIMQIFFPRKTKTAKYAGNWDPNARQPWSYKMQRWILANTFLTKNMQVLVYGQWPGSSGNIKSFFTASYKEADKTPVVPRDLNSEIVFLFVGTFLPSKEPLYAVRLVEQLKKIGYNVSLSLFGDGNEMPHIREYIHQNKLQDYIKPEGNQNQQTIKEAYQRSHFVILPSQSEGWPKVIAEGMFWGCVPIATPVSCLEYMLGHGNRGMLLKMDMEQDSQQITALLKDPEAYKDKALNSIEWSRKYTLDLFENEIKALIS